MVRATSSLPVPFSPVISIQVSAGAATSIFLLNSFVLSEFPSIECFSRVLVRRYLFSSSSRLKFRALLMVKIILSIESGFSTRSKAPSLVALTAVSIVPWPVIMTTWMWGLYFLISFSVSIPSIPGIQISSRTTSGESESMIFKASYPLTAVETSKPSSESRPLRD